MAGHQTGVESGAMPPIDRALLYTAAHYLRPHMLVVPHSGRVTHQPELGLRCELVGKRPLLTFTGTARPDPRCLPLVFTGTGLLRKSTGYEQPLLKLRYLRSGPRGLPRRPFTPIDREGISLTVMSLLLVVA